MTVGVTQGDLSVYQPHSSQTEVNFEHDKIFISPICGFNTICSNSKYCNTSKGFPFERLHAITFDHETWLPHAASG